MEICVFNHGCTHPYLRTYALSKYCDIGLFVDNLEDVRNAKILRDNDIDILILDGTKQFSFWKAYKKIKTLNYDSYVIHFASGMFLWAAVLARKSPLIAVAMGNDILNTEGDGKIGLIRRILNKKMLKKCDLIIAKSKLIKSKLKELNIKCPITVNYWGVYTKYFNRIEQSEARNKLNLPLDKKIILSPRSFEYRCNLHLILEAFSKLFEKDKDLFLVFIGGKNNKEYFKKIRERISELGLGKNVRIDDSVANDKIIDYYSASDLAVSVAKSDGFPNSVLEMMYCKVPVIAGNIPHINDILLDNINSFLCELDSNSLENRMRYVISLLGTDKMNSITENAYNDVLMYGDIEKNAEIASQNIKALDIQSKRSFLLIDWALLLMYFIFRKLKIES